MADKERVIIIGAAGSDYHTFNTYFRDNKNYEVVAFTMAAEQNIGTAEGDTLRRYPKALAGDLYPRGIPTYYEHDLEKIIKRYDVDMCVLAYHDTHYVDVMRLASRVMAAGASFRIFGSKQTMIESKKPLVAVCAVRTGCGKSQVSRKVVRILKEKGYKVIAIREPMPYGDLKKQACMRFATYEDLKKHGCTIEEREEYEPYIDEGLVIYSGVDYGQIIKEAEKEADVIVWDGGNNEISYYVPDLLFVLADPHRPGHETLYYAGEINARTADVLIINKENTAKKENIEKVVKNLKSINPKAKIIHADSVVSVDNPARILGKRVIVVEDGPTLTHGNMAYGAGTVAAKEHGCAMVDPRPFCEGSLKDVYKKFPQLGKVLPAMGYSDEQLRELESVINMSDAEVVLAGTLMDLTKVIKVRKPIVRVTYDIEEIGKPNLESVLARFEKKYLLK